MVTLECGNVTFIYTCSTYVSTFYRKYLYACVHMEFEHNKNAGLILIVSFILLPKIAYCLLGMLKQF